jgi:hypothetical protein
METKITTKIHKSGQLRKYSNGKLIAVYVRPHYTKAGKGVSGYWKFATK